MISAIRVRCSSHGGLIGTERSSLAVALQDEGHRLIATAGFAAA